MSGCGKSFWTLQCPRSTVCLLSEPEPDRETTVRVAAAIGTAVSGVLAGASNPRMVAGAFPYCCVHSMDR